MSHIRGHIIKGANKFSKLEDYAPSGNFDVYVIKVLDYHSEYGYISDSDSKSREYGDVILVLTKSGMNLQQGATIDMILKVQSFYPYSENWTLNGINNWLVLDDINQTH